MTARRRSEAVALDSSSDGREAAWLARLARAGEAEICTKQGRSRRFERDATGEQLATAIEAGWAVRAGDLRQSWFVAASGELPDPDRPGGPLAEPNPTPHPLWLPEPRPVSRRASAAGPAAALAGESEMRALLAAIERELAREAPGARLETAHLEEGLSSTSIVSTRGVAARTTHRAAWLRLEVERAGRRLTAESQAPELRDVQALGLARRVGDRLTALDGRHSPSVMPGLLRLAPAVGARLLAAMVPGLVGREAAGRAGSLGGVGAIVGSAEVTVVDDGGLPGGLLAAPTDGEGVACGAATLIEEGRLARTLCAWWECDEPAEATGCMRRASWRDLPRRAPTHLYLQPDQGVAPLDLITAEGGSGAYVIDVEGGVAVDPASGRFAMPVCGYILERGRAAGGFGRRLLTGSLRDWLNGVRGRGRDLDFVAGDGMFGAPTLLVEGLELIALRD